MNEQVDLYCERMGPEFWAEPINAWSNLAFIVSGLVCFYIWRRHTPDDRFALFLVLLIFAQALGSFLFHTFATRWAGLTDVLPIVIFIISYIAIGLRRFLGLGWLACAAFLLLFVGVVPGLSRLLEPIVGGSSVYLPALFTAFIVGFFCFPINRTVSIWIFSAGCVFAASLSFRILDEPICSSFTVGTHFLWHIFNAITVFLLLRILIWHRAGYVVDEIEVR